MNAYCQKNAGLNRGFGAGQFGAGQFQQAGGAGLVRYYIGQHARV